MSCLYLLTPRREAHLRFDWHGRKHDGWREEIRAFHIRGIDRATVVREN